MQKSESTREFVKDYYARQRKNLKRIFVVPQLTPQRTFVISPGR